MGDSFERQLVLLHGFMGNADDWLPVMKQLNASSVINLELPWHGVQIAHRPKSWLELLAEVGAGLPDGAHLVGYSFGARIALGLAATSPEKAGALTLLSGNPGISDPSARATRLGSDAALAKRLRDEDLKAFLRWWYDLPLFNGVARNPRLKDAMVEQRLNNDAEALGDCLTVAGTAMMPDYRAFISDSAIPLHYLAGALDAKYCKLAGELKDLRPDARVDIVADVSHALVQEAPDAVAAFINDVHANLD
jgi:2-succinyl-6-hydroxy-2,4-cyclohexadiene-1-carboxylate synthase